MAALRLVRRWGIPLATAASTPMLVPLVTAEAGDEEGKDTLPPHPTSRMVRPSDLPIYEEPEEVLDFEYHGRERSSLEEGVGVVRHEVEGILEATRSARERITQIFETGKEHSMAMLDALGDIRGSTDEENVLPRAGAITVGGLAGLVIGARRRGGFFKKVLYTSTGVITAASLCYPRQAYAVSQQLYGVAKNYGAIGYNFVVGVKPQSKTPPPPPPPPPPPSEAPKESETEGTSATPATADDAPQVPAPTPEPQGAEVRSAMAVTLSPGKSLIDTLAEQASDVTVWGFRLTDRDSTAKLEATPITPQDVLVTVPEGFGSVGTAGTGRDVTQIVSRKVKGESEGDTHKRQVLEDEGEAGSVAAEDEGASLKMVVEEVKEGAAVIGEKVAEEEMVVLEMVEEGMAAVEKKTALLEEKASVSAVEVLSPVIGKKVAKEVVEEAKKVVQEAVEKVAEVGEEKLAVVVEEVAREVEEDVGMVGAVVDVVEETGEKVEKALGVVERVIRAAESAAEVYPAVPAKEVEKVEKMVENTESVVEGITLAAKEVEGLTKNVRMEAEKVEEEATEMVESEEKRKEVVKEVEEILESKEKQDTDVLVEKQASTSLQVLPPLESQTEMDTPPVVPPTPTTPQEREGLFDKLVSFFSRPSKGGIDSAKEEQITAKDTEVVKSAKKVMIVPESARLVKRKSQSGTESNAPTAQLTDDDREPVVVPGESTSLEEDVVEILKGGIAIIEEKVVDVEEEVLEMVEEGVTAIGEKAVELEEKASTAVVEVLSPVLGMEGAKKVEKMVEGFVEKVAEGVVEKVAVVVEEAAREVEEEASVVRGVAEVVVETGEKVEKALGVVERVTRAAEAAAEVYPAVPAKEVEKVEKMVENTEAVVESITLTAKEVEGITEDVRREAERVEKVATEVVESEEKRKEVLKEVLEILESKGKQDTDVVAEKQASTSLQVLPPQEGKTDMDTPPVVPPTPAAPQERERLFDKLVSFISKPSKGALDSAKEVQTATEGPAQLTDSVKVTETAPVTTSKSIPLLTVDQDTQKIEALNPGTVRSELQPAEISQVQETIPTESTEIADSKTETTAKPEPLTPEKTDSEITKKFVSEATEKSVENFETVADVVDEVEGEQQQLIGETEGEKGPVKELKGEKGQVAEVEGETGWVMVEMEGKKEEEVEAESKNLWSSGNEDQDTKVKHRAEDGVESEVSGCGEGLVPTTDILTVPGKREGLFDQLMRLFTKDEEKPVASSVVLVPQKPVPAGAVEGPLPGEGEGKEPSVGTPVGEGLVAPAKPECTVKVHEMPLASEDTAQAPDVPQVVVDLTHVPDIPVITEDTAQICDTQIVSEDTAQIPEGTVQVLDLTQVPQDTVKSFDVPPIPREEQTQEKEVVDSTTPSGSEAVRESAGTLGPEQEAEGTSLHPVAESTHTPLTSSPIAAERKTLLDKLSSLFLKEEQQQELQHTSTPKGEVKKPLTEAQEKPAAEVKDMQGGTEKQTSLVAGEGATAAEAAVLGSPQEEGSSVACMEESFSEPLSEPARESSAPFGGDVAKTTVAVTGGKEEEEATLQPLVSTSPQTEAEVVQEGKDVIVKLEPELLEKDYGQSNPEDSDMYTTRG